MNSFRFYTDFELPYNDNVYFVEVSGVKSRDEHDTFSWYTDVTKFVISDEMGNEVTETHPDYDDLAEEIMMRDYDAEYETECFDDLADLY